MARRFDGSDWAKELIERPCNADKCNWEFLDGENWSSLLSSQPQFSDKCNWKYQYGENWSRLLRIKKICWDGGAGG